MFGKSAHNHRVEKLLGDVPVQVTRSYREHFIVWEADLGLKLTPKNIWVMQFLVIELIMIYRTIYEY